MEWVETTGATVDEARLRALDTLGVAFDDAEVEVVEEAKSSLFGLRKSDARVRARVKPVAPRAKNERRERGSRRGGRNKGGDNRGGNGRSRGKRGGGQGQSQGKGRQNKQKNPQGNRQQGQKRNQNNQNRQQQQPKKKADSGRQKETEKVAMSEDSNTPLMDAKGQADVVEEFMGGLLEAFGATATLDSVALDEDTFEVRADGGELGLLIGPKGATMRSIQDIARTAVQQEADGSLTGRVHLDIGGYRSKRREALAEFVTRLAEGVRETGESKALEPMPATDRKVIHDTIADIDGVVTVSEGQDRSRHIVLSPAE